MEHNVLGDYFEHEPMFGPMDPTHNSFFKDYLQEYVTPRSSYPPPYQEATQIDPYLQAATSYMPDLVNSLHHQPLMHGYNNNCMPEYPLNEMSYGPKMHAPSEPMRGIPQSVICENTAYKPLVEDANMGYDLLGYATSPLFTQELKMDADPFSPSIGSSISSVASVEMPDKSYKPGSVDSGVVVHGSNSSPYMRNDGSNDNMISPLAAHSSVSDIISPRISPCARIEVSPAARMEASPAARMEASPASQMISPLGQMISPRDFLISPRDQMISPKEQEISPKEFVTPSRRESVISLNCSRDQICPETLSMSQLEQGNSPSQEMASPEKQIEAVSPEAHIEAVSSEVQIEAVSPETQTEERKASVGSPHVELEPLSQETIENATTARSEKCTKGKRKLVKRERTAKRPRAKALTYESQIAPTANGIKLKISLKPVTSTTVNVPAPMTGPLPVSTKRRRLKKPTTVPLTDELAGQGGWADDLPDHALRRIFRYATPAEGCMPFMMKCDYAKRCFANWMPLSEMRYEIQVYALTLWKCHDKLNDQEMAEDVHLSGYTVHASNIRRSFKILKAMSHVCQRWRSVALYPKLWRIVDLSNKCVSKNPIVNDLNFVWFCENRLSRVQDLNLTGWSFSNITLILEKIAHNCPELRDINFTNWDGLNPEHVRYIADNFPHLQRVNLSCVSMNQGSNNKSGVALNGLLHLIEKIGERLTHLILSDNRLVGIPQIINALAEHCPNLEVFDLSNVRTLSATGHIHIERFQEGCQKLRILRITNSQVSPQPVPIKERISSPGFPHLEELSVACITNSLSSLTNPYVDDDAIERLLKTSTKLKLLDARNCAKVTKSSLVRVPAWDLTHLYLSGSYVTRVNDCGLELIAQKWSHSLIEVDFSWCTVTKTLDAAVFSLAEQDNSPLKILDLTGSSVNLEPVQAVLKRCHALVSLNVTSCRALPRGMKRLYVGQALEELKSSLQPAQTSDTSANGKE